ncbi:thioredoxin [Paenibacillus sp. MER TA 81-3]|uniref:thioredoxin n=1 Tax=Paenibacillus sp. MER TA 81-3 TaxID=2939573 RepID=UPI00203B909D|nr:thioredoxin [Paenibacillus sp. MER TA 81-3]MCM3340719.1 thioredoxin [Paenibacillus sp. MER TA 81-3]
MTIYHVTDATFHNELQSEGLTVVNFWATWCGPCRMFAPILEAYDAEGSNGAKILKVNVDENAETAALFGIMGIPATILFKNGEPVNKKVGVMSLEGLKRFISGNQ